MSPGKVKMPRAMPSAGKVHVVVAIKGLRISELWGELPRDQAIAVLQLASMSHAQFLETTGKNPQTNMLVYDTNSTGEQQ